MKCRHCQNKLTTTFVDLDKSPPSNAYLALDELDFPEKEYPLRVLVCEKCWLVQTEDFTQADDLFDADYAYFSSFSTSWLKHSEEYANTMINRFDLGKDSCVVEIAANDGYLLQYFQQNSVPNYGVEPTMKTAQAARDKGIEIVEDFFGEELGKKLYLEGKGADLMAANNVLAHVPNINDFLKGFTALLNEQGVATFEFPHLCELIKNNQFDTIYHEHFSYLSLYALVGIFEKNGLKVFDVEKLFTHGGSLRVFVQHIDTGKHEISLNVTEALDEELSLGINKISYYLGFQEKSDLVKSDFVKFIDSQKQAGKKIAAYGAAAKGNTLLNYSKVTRDSIDFVVDRNPEKQGKALPGSRIPIVSEDYLKEQKPEVIIIFPWNLIDEVRRQLSYVYDWNAKLVIALPELTVFKS